MDDFCAGCVYRQWAGSRSICGYLLTTGHRRPCPPGENCAVKKIEGDVKEMPRRSTFDKERARELYYEDKKDIEIADMVGATESAIKSWRRRENLRPKRDPNPGGTRPEVTVDIPEGLQPAVRKDPLEGFEPVQIEPPAPPEPAAELPAAPDPEPPKIPMPEEPPATAKQDAEDPVTVEIIYRGCHVCVDADRLEQISVAGKILAGISAVFDAVSNSGTNKTPTNK